MDFKIDDILNNTIDGVPKEVLSTVISEVITETDKNVSEKLFNNFLDEEQVLTK